MKKLLFGFLLLALSLISVPAQAAARFIVCTVTCTWDAADTTLWSATSGGATGASVPGSGDTVTLDGATCVGGVTCTITVNTTVNVTSITMGACTASTTGCILDFAANDNNVTVGSFSGTGTGTRTLNMGDGTWTVTNTSGTPWTMGTVTNLTFNRNASTLVFTATTTSLRIITFGALTYNNVTFSANSSGGGAYPNGTGATIAGTLSFVGPNYVLRENSTTFTVSGTISVTGSLTAMVTITSDSASSNATWSTAGALVFDYTIFRNSTFSGAGSWTANNSLNAGLVSGITINVPVTGGGGRIIGGWLLDPTNDNHPMFLDRAA